MEKEGLIAKTGALFNRGEQGPSEEGIHNSNRVVVFGSNIDFNKFLPDIETTLSEIGIKNVEVRLVRNVHYLSEGFYGNYPTQEHSDSPKTLPRGVVLLPTMRQYWEGMGGNVSTYGCGVCKDVRDMCQENDVPLVEIHLGNTKKRINRRLRKLIA